MLNLNDNTIRFLAAAGFFLVWVGLVAFKVPNSDDLISFCKDGLGAVGLYHLATTRATPAIPPSA
jgi:hypothetical protein